MSFSIPFLFNSLLLTLPILLFLGIKKVLSQHLTVKARAFSWYLFFLLLTLPLLPAGWFSSIAGKISAVSKHVIQNFLFENGLWEKFPGICRLFQSQELEESWKVSLSNTAPFTVNRKIVDFSLSIERSSFPALSRILFGVWLTGVIVVLLLTIWGFLRIERLRCSAIPVTAYQEYDLFSLLEQCKKELHWKKHVSLYRSHQLSSPVSYGVFRPKILIPEDLDILFSEKEVHYILLHELAHHKRRDALLNYLRCLFLALYWFHPAVWYGFHNLSSDREVACDTLVIDTIGEKCSLEYGQTILHYAGKLLDRTFSPVSGIGGSHSQLKERIYQIVNYKAAGFSQRLKSFLILFVIFLLILTGSPFLGSQSFAYGIPSDNESWKDTNPSDDLESASEFSEDMSSFYKNASVKTEDLSTYFKGMDGTFVLYEMNQNSYEIYQEDKSKKRYSPASTYKIYSGLFALEEKILTPENNRMTWDGTSWPFEAWNQNQDLTSAMQNSVNWYFQTLDRKLGLQKLTSYYKKISYGNSDLSSGINDYWRESSLKISPMEQVRLLASLNQNKWGFDESNIQAVKQAMLISHHKGCSLYGKTGTGNVNHYDVNGWFVGMVENQEGTWCFAVHIEGKEGAGGQQASSIALDILRAKGIYQ